MRSGTSEERQFLFHCYSQAEEQIGRPSMGFHELGIVGLVELTAQHALAHVAHSRRDQAAPASLA